MLFLSHAAYHNNTTTADLKLTPGMAGDVTSNNQCPGWYVSMVPNC